MSKTAERLLAEAAKTDTPEAALRRLLEAFRNPAFPGVVLAAGDVAFSFDFLDALARAQALIEHLDAQAAADGDQFDLFGFADARGALSPCPYCGNVEERTMARAKSHAVTVIECVRCGATGPRGRDPEALWNDRSAPDLSTKFPKHFLPSDPESKA